MITLKSYLYLYYGVVRFNFYLFYGKQHFIKWKNLKHYNICSRLW